MQIKYLSDVGLKRETNQDFANVFFNQASHALLLLADGMGGHQAGDVASRSTVEMLGAKWKDTNFDEPDDVEEWLVTNIQEINEMIYRRGQNDPDYTGMGTTIVAAAVFSDVMVIAHVGDSRAYTIHDQTMYQLTQDHSLVNVLLQNGELTQEEAYHHPRKNVLTRSVGMPGTVEVDVTIQAILPGDYLLLCSDGLTNMVTDQGILEILSWNDTLENTVYSLVQQANENGGKDNITVLLAKFDEDKGGALE
ncbi:MAG: Stp1/IreP family PP2C-type Ser/Thr phosphatase [Streptococcaceae bacterium]|jgi:protein phosphatase|nr:Stp1/IreP family PP2C-type Ser/Thr phosphatase [Streptococcaceae bacterium]